LPLTYPSTQWKKRKKLPSVDFIYYDGNMVNTRQGRTILRRVRESSDGRTNYMGREWALMVTPADAGPPLGTPSGATTFVTVAQRQIRMSAVPYRPSVDHFIERTNGPIHPFNWQPQIGQPVQTFTDVPASWRMVALRARSSLFPRTVLSVPDARALVSIIRTDLWAPHYWMMQMRPSVVARIHIELSWLQNDTVSTGNMTTTFSRRPWMQMFSLLGQILDRYNARGFVEITAIYIDYLLDAPFFAQGARAFYEFSQHYYIVSPNTKHNCAYMAAALCLAVHEQPVAESLLDRFDLKKQAESWKRKVEHVCGQRGIPFQKEGTDLAVMTVLAELMEATITIRDNLFDVFLVVGTGAKHLEMQVRNNHVMSLIRRALFDEDDQEGLDQVFMRWRNAECEVFDYVVRREMGETEPRKIMDRSHQRMQVPAAYVRMQKILRGEITVHEKRLGTFDVETYGDDFQPYMLGFCFECDAPVDDLAHIQAIDRKVCYVEFRGRQCFQQWFTWMDEHIDRVGNITIYAHNFGKFDGLMMLDEIFFQTHFPQFRLGDALEQGGSWIFVEVKHMRGFTIKFRDSVRLLPGSLANLTKEFDVEHKKLVETVDHTDVTSENWHTDAIATPMALYLLHDVVGLYEVLRMFQRDAWNDYHIDVTDCMTAASLSKRVFQCHYQNMSRPIYDLTWELDGKIREAYFGGRNECFVQKEVEHCYYYDITSLYPDVMAHRDYPWGKCRVIHTDNLGELFGFVECDVRSIDTQRKPLHAVKAHHRLCFPHLDEWTTLTLFSEEVRLGMSENMYEYRVRKVYSFDRGPILSKYALDAFEGKRKAKAEGKLAVAFIKKLLANAGYGWFGIRTQGKSGVKIFPKNDKQWVEYMFAGELVAWGDRGDYTLVRTKSELPVKDFNVAIAAAVTAWARMKLWTSMDLVERHGGKVYYCDTDSLITDMDLSVHEEVARTLAPDGFDEHGWTAWKAGEELGSFKNELCDKLKKWLTKEQLAEYKLTHRNPAFHRGIIALCKLYALQYCSSYTGLKHVVTAAKGLTQSAFQILLNDQLINPEDGRTVAARESDGKFYTDSGHVFLPGLLRNVDGHVVDKFGNVKLQNDEPVKMGKLVYEEYHDLLMHNTPIVRHNEMWVKPTVDMLRESHEWQLSKRLTKKEILLANKYCKGHVEDGVIRPLHFPQDAPRLMEEELDTGEEWEPEEDTASTHRQFMSFEEFRSFREAEFWAQAEYLTPMRLEVVKQRFASDVEYRALCLEYPAAALEDYLRPYDELVIGSEEEDVPYFADLQQEEEDRFMGVTPPPSQSVTDDSVSEDECAYAAAPHRKRFRSIFVDDEAADAEDGEDEEDEEDEDGGE
jgi:hypothetical protein